MVLPLLTLIFPSFNFSRSCISQLQQHQETPERTRHTEQQPHTHTPPRILSFPPEGHDHAGIDKGGRIIIVVVARWLVDEKSVALCEVLGTLG